MNHKGRATARLMLGTVLSLCISLGGIPAQALAEQASPDVTLQTDETDTQNTQPIIETEEDATSSKPTAQTESSPNEGANAEDTARKEKNARIAAKEEQLKANRDAAIKAKEQEQAKAAQEELENEEPGLIAQANDGTWGTCAWTLDSNGTLTIGPGEGETTYPWYASKKAITSVRFVSQDGKKAVASASMNRFFAFCPNLKTVDLSGLDTSKVTSMHSLFFDCGKLESIKGSAGLDTSKVTDMSDMFWGCTALTDLDVSTWDTSRSTSFSYMFWGCKALTSLDVSGWCVSNAKDFSNMFGDCESLTELDVSRWDTFKGTNFSAMFYGCANLKKLDCRNWNTSGVNSDDNASNAISLLFYNCNAVSQISVGTSTKPFDLPKGVDHGSGEKPYNGWWYSQSDKTWYKQEDIVNDRLGIEDTYTKTDEPVVIPPKPEVNKPTENNEDNTSPTPDTTDDNGTHTLDVRILLGKGVPTVTSSNLSEIAPKLLDSDELARFNEGENAKVWLSVKPYADSSGWYSSSVAQYSGKTYKSGLGISATYDITLWKQIGNDDPVSITKTGDNVIDLTLQVPDDLVNTDQSVTRTYYLYRMHLDHDDPSASSFDTLAKTTETSIGFSTDKFSYYSLGYIDRSNTNTVANTGSNKTASTGTKASTPKTGDPLLGGVVWAALAAGSGSVYAGRRMRSRKE